MKEKKPFYHNFDFYGIDFPLRYKNEDKFSSIIGLILSLISMFLILIIIIYNVKNIFNYKFYTLYTIESFNNECSLNLENLEIMIGIVDNKGNFIEIKNEYFKISAQISNFISLNKNNFEYNFTVSFLELTSCK